MLTTLLIPRRQIRLRSGGIAPVRSGVVKRAVTNLGQPRPPDRVPPRRIDNRGPVPLVNTPSTTRSYGLLLALSGPFAPVAKPKPGKTPTIAIPQPQYSMNPPGHVVTLPPQFIFRRMGRRIGYSLQEHALTQLAHRRMGRRLG